MSNLLDDLVSNLGSGGVSQIAGALGADESQLSNVIGMALPAILGGMANNAAKPEGAQALHSALDDHDEGVFGQLGDLLGGGGAGDGILGHVLGGKRDGVEQQLAGNSGMDLGMIKKLLPILAPLVMGYLSRQKKQQGLDAGGLGAMLGQERQQAEQRSPGLGGLASILDADGDGFGLDDVIDMATGAAGGGQQKSAGGLAGILSKFLRR